MPRRRVRSTSAIRQRQAVEAYVNRQERSATRAIRRALKKLPVSKAAGDELNDALYGVLLRVTRKGGDVASKYSELKPALMENVKRANVHKRSEKWAKKRSASLVVDVTEGQRKAIRAIIADGRRAGLHTSTVSKMVKNVVGLDERRARAASNFWLRQMEAGVSESKATAQARAYADRLLTQRAQMIARTEMVAAMHEGKHSFWSEVAAESDVPKSKVTREWFTVGDNRVDDICERLDGKTTTLDGQFPGGYTNPPAHPGCRCDVLFEFEEG